MVSQTTRAFGIAIEAKAFIKNLMNKDKGYLTQAIEVKETAKKASSEVEALKKSQVEESIKLASALAKIENLNKEVHLSQSKVASLTKRVETSDNRQRIATEALELINKEKASPKEQVEEPNFYISSLVEEVETVRREAESTGNKVNKRYIANFHLMEAYQRFAIY